MVGYEQSRSSSTLPRVRIDLRDIHRLDQLKSYHVDIADEIDLKNTLKKIFFIPSLNQELNNDIHRALVLSDATVVTGQLSFSLGESVVEYVRQMGKVHCVVIVLNGDCLLRFKNIDVDKPMTTPSPVFVFLLGQLIALLGRKYVVVLHEDGPYFQCPTNYFDASYIPLDPDARWKRILSGHLRSLDVRVNENTTIDSFFNMKVAV